MLRRLMSRPADSDAVRARAAGDAARARAAGDAARTLRRFCLACQGGYHPSVITCADTSCPLYPLRRSAGMDEDPSLWPDAPARAIRRFCLGCAGSRSEVRRCDAKGQCALWSFRFGVSPATFKRIASRLKFRRSLLFLPGFER
jgi:hypothetical protein